MALESNFTPDNGSTASTTSVEIAAQRELGAFFRGETLPAAPTVEPTPTVQTEPPAAPQPPPVTPTVETSGAPTPPPEGQPSVSPPGPEDPVEKKVRDIFGDDPKRAAEAILATNNRAAAMATKLKELGLDPRTLQPLSVTQPLPVQVPPAPAPVDTKTIEAETTRLLDNDPAFVSLVQTWMQGDTKLKEIATSRTSVEDEIKRFNYALSIPEIKDDDYKRDQYSTQIAQKEQTLLKLQLEESIIEAKQERLNAAASRFTEKARTAVQQHYQSETEKRQEEADLAQYQQDLYAQYSTSWPLAIEKAAADAKIPAELLNDFKEEAKVAALAHLQDTDAPIENIYQFVAKRAQVMMDRMDRFHRMQSATYGNLAATRTAIATSTIPTPPVAPQPSTSASPSSTSTVSFERALEIESALVAKQMGLWG